MSVIMLKNLLLLVCLAKIFKPTDKEIPALSIIPKFWTKNNFSETAMGVNRSNKWLIAPIAFFAGLIGEMVSAVFFGWTAGSFGDDKFMGIVLE
jgi:hypothetical protein